MGAESAHRGEGVRALGPLQVALALLKEKHGDEAAVHDQRGALLGAFGMAAFALVAAAAFGRLQVGVMVALAWLAWASVAVGTYLAVTRWRDRHRTVPPVADA